MRPELVEGRASTGARTEFVEGLSALRVGPANPRDLSLDLVEERLVNVVPCPSQSQHCRAHQAVRDRNHWLARHEGDKLGFEAGWSSQHAADNDAAADHDRAR